MARRARNEKEPSLRREEKEPSLRRALAWAAITFAMAGAAGGAGYVAGATGEAAAEPPPASAPPQAMPELLRATDIYATGRRAGVRATRPRALAAGRRQGRMRGRVEAGARFRPGQAEYRGIFEAGRRAGAREALADFAGDGFYVVGVSRGGRRVSVGRRPLRPGESYGLCDGGRRACLSQDNRDAVLRVR